MVVGKEEFNKALTEINESYLKLWKKIEELEAEIAELKKPKTRTKADAA